MTFMQILEQDKKIQVRRALSEKKLVELRDEFSRATVFSGDSEICVFAAGSLGRLDSGASSDLDVFVTTTAAKVSRLREFEVFASIMRINDELSFPKLSNDGQYLKVFDIPKNEETIGSPDDDKYNWFTTRMLLLLESNFLYNESGYHAHKSKILEFYFRDAATHSGFRPVFLLNDILRYWRTVCLNYEQARSVPGKSWKKRNFNLKFSRLLSVYGTVLPLMLIKDVTAARVEELTSQTPIERLALGLDLLNGAMDLQEGFKKFLEYYESFLAIKESIDFDKVTDETKEELRFKADFVAQFIFDAVNHDSVPQVIRRYLVI